MFSLGEVAVLVVVGSWAFGEEKIDISIALSKAICLPIPLFRNC
jgi:hypothetical protein